MTSSFNQVWTRNISDFFSQTRCSIVLSVVWLLFSLSHRPLKLWTDGGQTRVRELGSIDLFVVTFLKMNELSPNFEHKLLIMCGMLAANFIAIRSAIPALLWPPVSRLADDHCKMLQLFRSFFAAYISEISGPIVTKLCYMFDGDCSL